MKISWKVITLLVIIVFLEPAVSRFSSSSRNFIKNRRMANHPSIRAKVSKYLKKITIDKKKQIQKRTWKKKNFSRIEKRHGKRKEMHNRRKEKHRSGVHQESLERKIHHNFSKFKRKLKIKARKDKIRERKIKTFREQEIRNDRQKKEKKNIREYRTRRKEKTLKALKPEPHLYPMTKPHSKHLSSLRLEKEKKYQRSKVRFLKLKNSKPKVEKANNVKESTVVLKQKATIEQSKNEYPIPDRQLDEDSDIKLNNEHISNIPTLKKIYTKVAVKNANPNALQLPRELLEVGDYADMNKSMHYNVNKICEMRQAQALKVAREIITQQSRKLFSKLTNYLLKGKLLVNMTKVKINKALKSKIKELLTPDNLKFTMKDIHNLGDDLDGSLDDLSHEDTHDYVHKDTYDEFEGLNADLAPNDKIKWNLG